MLALWQCVCVLVYSAAYSPHDTSLDHCYPHCMGKGMKIQEGYFLQAGFPAAALLSFGVRYTIFRVVVDLCFVGCLAASRCSTHWLQVTPPSCDSHQ